jgi:hypothetical protein
LVLYIKESQNQFFENFIAFCSYTFCWYSLILDMSFALSNNYEFHEDYIDYLNMARNTCFGCNNIAIACKVIGCRLIHSLQDIPDIVFEGCFLIYHCILEMEDSQFHKSSF